MKKNTLYFIITALVLLNIFTIFKLNILKKNMENQFQQNELAINNIRNEINGIYSNVDAKLKKQASILDNHNLTLGELKPSSFTIPVTLSITPKEYSEGLTATLLLNDKSVLMKKEGTSFVATSEAYIFDDLIIKVVLEQNGVKKTETIEEYYDLQKKYLLEISGGYSGQSSYGSGKYESSGKINLDFLFPPTNSIEKIKLIKDVNGATVDERDIATSNHVAIDVKDNIKFAFGDKLTVYAIVQDRYGLNYKYVLSVFETDSKGDPVKDNYQLEMRRIAEISDRNGKILYAPKNDLGK